LVQENLALRPIEDFGLWGKGSAGIVLYNPQARQSKHERKHLRSSSGREGQNNQRLPAGNIHRGSQA